MLGKVRDYWLYLCYACREHMADDANNSVALL